MTNFSNGCPDESQLVQLLNDTNVTDLTVDEHVQNCSDCQRKMDQLSSIKSLDEYRGVAKACMDPTRLLDPPIRRGDLGSIAQLAIESKIGSGAMGIVYRGYDLTLERTVAIKVLANGGSQEAVSRFAREAKAAAALDHPNIVRVYSSGSTSNWRPYLVMPLIEGASLKERLASGPLATRDAAKIVKQIADGMDSAHQLQLNHRDVKPSNILIDESDSQAKLADFGLVQSVADETLTQQGVICGTPEYMSPEQAQDPDALDSRGDIYSLGIVLYECIAGSTPFRGRPLDIIQQHREHQPIPPRQLNREVPGDLSVICLKAIDKDPSRRYQSAREFSDDLERFLQGQPILARPSGPILKAFRWAKRNASLSSTMGLLFVVLVAGFATSATLWMKSDQSWRLAEKRNESLKSNQLVLESNQRKLGEALNATYFNTLQNKSEFMQLPTALRNSVLMALRNTCELLFDQGQDDPEQLRKITDILALGSEVAFRQGMFLRANELTELNHQVTDRLLVVQDSPSAPDLVRASNANYQLAYSFVVRDQKEREFLPDAKANYAIAKQYGDEAFQVATAEEHDLVAQEALIRSFYARLGQIQIDDEMNVESKLESLESMAASIESTLKSETLLNLWIDLQQNVAKAMARVSPPKLALENRRKRAQLLKRLIAENEKEGSADIWNHRNLAVNSVIEGSMSRQIEGPESARKIWGEALERLSQLSDAYPLNSQFRADKFELQWMLANLEWDSKNFELAMKNYALTSEQLDIAIKLNPKDHFLLRRKGQLLGLLGDRYLDLDDSAEAARAYNYGAKITEQAGNHPNNTVESLKVSDLSFAAQLKEKATNTIKKGFGPNQFP